MALTIKSIDRFNPQTDTDAAVKLVLSIIFMDERWIELESLLTDNHEVGGLEGDPGWLIERRDVHENPTSYVNWPKTAGFHIHVDENNYCLAFPDMYLERELFHSYVRKAIEEYFDSHFSESKMINSLQGIIRLIDGQALSS